MGLGGEAVVSILVIVLDIHTVLLINGNIVYIVAACFSPLLLGNVVDLLNMKVITACDASDDEVCVLIAKTDSDRLIEVIDRLYRLGLAVNIKRDGVIGPLTAVGAGEMSAKQTERNGPRKRKGALRSNDGLGEHRHKTQRPTVLPRWGVDFILPSRQLIS